MEFKLTLSRNLDGTEKAEVIGCCEKQKELSAKKELHVSVATGKAECVFCGTPLVDQYE